MNNRSLRILSIDPGTSYTGICIADLFSDDILRVRFVETINAERLAKHLRDIEHIYGARYARILAIGNQLQHLLELYSPDVIVSEAPFYNPSRPQAYGALVEVVTMLKTTVCRYNSSLTFVSIDPSTVKKGVGVSGASGDKDLMKLALQKCNILYEAYLNPNSFDEHSVDAVAVAFGYCKTIN